MLERADHWEAGPGRVAPHGSEEEAEAKGAVAAGMVPRVTAAEVPSSVAPSVTASPEALVVAVAEAAVASVGFAVPMVAE